jgi:hypothetical protein
MQSASLNESVSQKPRRHSKGSVCTRCRDPGWGSGAPERTVFRWTTFGLAIESKVHEYVLNQRLGWYGYAPGAKPSFYHS